MPAATVESYRPELAGEVAELIHAALREHEGLRLDLTSRPLWELGKGELAEVLREEAVCAEASFVATAEGRLASAVIARKSGEATGWWCIATHPDLRRRGLASACLAAAEEALRETGAERAGPIGSLDSRWRSGCGFLEAAGYAVNDPERDSISLRMAVDRWEPREVVAPAGYEILGLVEGELEEWMACHHVVFESTQRPEWFRRAFMSRHDFTFEGWHVAKHRARIVGMAAAMIVREEPDPSRVRGAMIEYVGVHPDHRRKGLAEALMVGCLNHCKRMRAQPIMLITQPFRVPAVRLYEKLGFVKIAEVRRYEKGLGGG